jgi:two-component system alkaline phosphatase synthesis response regulator PhoP
MTPSPPSIFFVDNMVNSIFKSIESLKNLYPGLKVFNSEQELFEQLEVTVPDVIFLNLDLQPNDAVLVTREIRNRFPLSPPFIIIYSNKQDDFVQELAFNSGVDGFINFHQKSSVLKLYLANLLRRKKQPADVVQKKVVIDSDRYIIIKQGENFQLPRKEFRLFELLYANSEKFFSKPEIAELIWEDSKVAKTRTIDVHIYNIRQIFGKRIIQSQKGKGYRMNKKVID